MDINQNPYMTFQGMTPEEWSFLQQATTELNENQKKYFYMVYSGKRKNPQDILLVTLLGFFGVAGVQRFVVGQIGMGILYLFTVGLCFIGSIVDIVNHKELAFEHNQRMVFESLQMVRMGNFQ